MQKKENKCKKWGVSVPGGSVCSWGVSTRGVSALGGVCSQGGCPGGVCSWGVSTLGGVCSWGGLCLLGGSALGGCLLGGVSALEGGVSTLGGVVSQHALRQTPPCGQTDACKNITFTTSLRTLKMLNVKFISQLYFRSRRLSCVTFLRKILQIINYFIHALTSDRLFRMKIKIVFSLSSLPFHLSCKCYDVRRFVTFTIDKKTSWLICL